ncbi:SARP family transcriptional regulator [Actinocatenispora sera]|uniref:SARP family transcriptional regulator n=1 Tax=Actinocatenispora sera TaxID=390989 RepID=A0A810KWT0_9ACTN|nr:SARP family transcriptional regulator [Actinocatenispora sera]
MVVEKFRLPEGLREARRRLGLTQDALAARAGLSVRAVRDLERGRVPNPRPATLRRLAAALQPPDVEPLAADPPPVEPLAAGPSAAAPAAGPEALGRSRSDRVGTWLQVLGPLLVIRDGEPVPVGSARRASLLALLALYPNTPVAVSDLLQGVWPDLESPPPELLHTHVSRIRRLLGAGGPRLERVGGAYRLVVDETHVDLLAFRTAAREADAAWADGRPTAALESWARCWRLWRGAPLADLPALAGQPAAAAIQREITAAAIRHADAALTSTVPVRGIAETALTPLTRLATLDPLDEAVAARLIRVLAAVGRRAHALDTYHRIRQALADDLAVRPGRQLQAAYTDILRADDDAGRAGDSWAGAERPYRWPAPAQLPADIPDFTGRDTALAEVRRLCDPGAAPLVVISGAGGTGKTTLAVRAGHLLRERFPDGQLCVDLRGAAPVPAAPVDVLRLLLTALRVAVPDGLEPAAALLRSVLADRRVLLVLDDARDVAQVRPLLPGGSGCAVLITSRRQLADLPGARHVALPPMSLDESVELLGRIAGATRVGAEADAARRIATACDGFPLATRIAGARLAARRHWTVDHLATRLSEARQRLSELAVGDLAVSASFRLSYDGLTPPQARAFRLLGLWPGADIPEPTAAALLDLPHTGAEELLEHLVDVHLLASTAIGRYRMHDLVRAYANDLASAVDPPSARAAALRRAVTHTAGIARLTRYTLLRETEDAFPDRAAAMAWVGTEYTNLTALTQLCRDSDLDIDTSAAAHLALALSYYDKDCSDHLAGERHSREALRFAEAGDDPWLIAHSRNQVGGSLLMQFRTVEAEPVLERALTEFRSIGDRQGETTAIDNLGLVHLQARRWDAAGDHFAQALRLAEEADDQENQALARLNLGVLTGMRGHYRCSRELLTDALSMARRIEHPSLTNRTQINLGCAWRELGDFDQARACFTEAADRIRREGGRTELGWALCELATTHRLAGDHEQAARDCRQALRILRQIRAPYEESVALIELGHLATATGHPTQATEHWRAAHHILTELGSPEADDVHTLLTAAHHDEPDEATR